jgi:hypothetical protein
MSVRIDDNADSLFRDANLPDPAGNWTVMFWVYIVSNTGALQDMFWLHEPDGGTTNYIFHGALSGLEHYYESVLGDNHTGTGLSTGTWYHIALTNNGTTREMFLNGSSDGSDGSLSSWTSTRVRLGNNPAASRHADIRIASYKEYHSVLTGGQITTEMSSWTDVLGGATANCRLNLHTDLTDESGNGNNFSSSGTLTTEANPPGLPSLDGGSTRINGLLLLGVG